MEELFGALKVEDEDEEAGEDLLEGAEFLSAEEEERAVGSS